MLTDLAVVGDVAEVVQLEPRPMRVVSKAARSMAQFDWISTSSSITTIPSWGTLWW